MERKQLLIEVLEPEGPPSPAGASGRDPTTGQFLPGNKLGTGNPHASRGQKLRAALFDAVSPHDIHCIVRRLVGLAKRGDLTAARLILDRCFGRPIPTKDIVEDDVYSPDDKFL